MPIGMYLGRNRLDLLPTGAGTAELQATAATGSGETRTNRTRGPRGRYFLGVGRAVRARAASSSMVQRSPLSIFSAPSTTAPLHDAALHEERLAAERAVGGGEVRDERRHVRRVPDVECRSRAPSRRRQAGRRSVRRVRAAGGDRVGAHAVARAAPWRRSARTSRCRSSRRRSWPGRGCENSPDVDDVWTIDAFTVLPALRLLAPVRGGVTGRAEVALQVHVDHGVPLGLGHVDDHAVAQDAGVVHEHVQVAEGVDGLVARGVGRRPSRRRCRRWRPPRHPSP